MRDYPEFSHELWDDYVFIDCETGGLNEFEHPLLEWTYAVGLNEPVTLYGDLGVSDVLTYCDPKALEVNQITKHYEGDEHGMWYKMPEGAENLPNVETHAYLKPGHWAWLKFPQSTQPEYDEFLNAIKGKTWVGANPDFDVRFLSQYFRPERLTQHHRLFDVEAYYAGQKSLAKIPGLSEIQKRINADLEAYDLPLLTPPDHTSRNDVINTREVFAYLVGYLSELRYELRD